MSVMADECERKRKRTSEPLQEAIDELSGDAVHATFTNGSSGAHCGRDSLSDAAQATLGELGIADLYTHQAHAREALLSGRNASLASGTASGKSLAFALPVLESLGQPSCSRCKALLLSPQKALSRDQAKNLRQIVSAASRASTNRSLKLSRGNRDVLKRIASIGIEHLDGDTPRDSRKSVVQSNRIILSNPDFVHSYLLLRHKELPALFNNLHFLVVDEAHTYLGVFGSHTSLLLRRLIRLAESTGSKLKPHVVTASATIGNPKEHFERLTGLPFEPIDSDGAPSGCKAQIFIKPAELSNPSDAQKRSGNTTRSPYTEAIERLKALIRRDIKTLCFVKTRKQVEEVTKLLHLQLKDDPQLKDYAHRIDSYRGGYSAQEREEIEGRLKSGHLVCLVTTSALELGIDIGSLDASVIIGTPRSGSAQHQQLGRSGRRNGTSIGLIIASDSPLDQYFLANPSEIFNRQIENATINPTNEQLMQMHLPFAANEVRLRSCDVERFGGREAFDRATKALISDKKLFYDGDSKGTYSAPPITSLPIFGLRSTSIESGRDVQLVDIGKNAEEPFDRCNGCEVPGARVERERAERELHKNAVYMHRRQAWKVKHLDIEKGIAYVASHEDNEVTYPSLQKHVSADARHINHAEKSKLRASNVWRGRVTVESTVVGYDVYYKNEDKVEKFLFDEKDQLEMPNLGTEAIWFDIPAEAIQQAPEEHISQGVYVLASLLGDLASSEALCCEDDVAGWPSEEKNGCDHGSSCFGIWIYDMYGGIGLCEELLERLESLVQRAMCAIESCECHVGCSKCILRGSTRISSTGTTLCTM